MRRAFVGSGWLAGCAALIGFAAGARGDVSIGGAAVKPPAKREVVHFVTPWPRVVSCTRDAKVTAYLRKGESLEWRGEGAALIHAEITDERGPLSMTPQELRFWTDLVIERPTSPFSESALVSVYCEEPRVEYKWLCQRGVCLPSVIQSAPLPATRLSSPRELAAIERLMNLDVAAVAARAPDFERLVRRLLTDLPPLLRAACAVGCTPAVERSLERARKLVVAPFAFRGSVLERSAPVGRATPAAAGAYFESAAGRVTVTCGESPGVALDRFCMLEHDDRLLASLWWSHDPADAGVHYQLDVDGGGEVEAILGPGPGVVDVSGSALDTR
jgi:hypothetical protein